MGRLLDLICSECDVMCLYFCVALLMYLFVLFVAWLTLYSLQRRRERYRIIYIWKIIEGLAPNISNLITSTFSGRRGRSCVISNVNVGRVGTLAYNSFRW